MDNDKITIQLSDRRPIRISKDTWPETACGTAYDGDHAFQANDGAWIRVREHEEDGRAIVYGYAGDWGSSCRVEREDRRAGFLLSPGDDVVQAIYRVAAILAETECVGDLAQEAARQCIANLPPEDDE